jgi:hypothetical protein
MVVKLLGWHKHYLVVDCRGQEVQVGLTTDDACDGVQKGHSGWVSDDAAQFCDRCANSSVVQILVKELKLDNMIYQN